MNIDPNALTPAEQYKLLAATVIPRPIALVTTLSRDGRDNAAPFSFFNVMGEDPPVLVLGLEVKRDGTLKDTTVNVRDTGEFVVHTVDEDLAEAMSVCAIDFPGGMSESEAAGLTLVPAEKVKPRRIAEAPVAFECEKVALLQISPGRNIAIGKVVMMHVRDELIDREKLYIDAARYRPIGRLYGTLYCRTRDRFELGWPSYEAWRRARGE